MPSLGLSFPSPFTASPDFAITITQTGNKAYFVALPYGPSYGFENLKECMEFVTKVFYEREES